MSRSPARGRLTSLLSLVLLVAFGAGLTGCQASPDAPGPASAPQAGAGSPPQAEAGPPPQPVDDWAYQLQNVDLDALGRSHFDLLVMDYSADGTDSGRFTAAQLQALHDGPGGPKIVLAYMSIGEAETYRWYWRPHWDADQDGRPEPGAPAWLDAMNPEWEGNYKVRYWEPAWQSIIFGTPDSYLDKIIDAGFDGVYLDIIDAYEYYAPGGGSGLHREAAEGEMVEFVLAIAHHARVTRGKPDFLVFPQNGSALAEHPDYVAAVSGIGVEDTWYNGDEPQDPSHTGEVLGHLETLRAAERLVLVVDYVTEPALIDDFYAKARARGYVPYATTRDLNVLTVNPGHEPD